MIATHPLQPIHKHQEHLQQEDFETIFGEVPGTLFQKCQELVGRHDLRYDTLQGASRDQVLLRVLKTLGQDLEVAGTHRKQRWEDGWAENFSDFQRTGYDLGALVPKFVRPQEIIRLKGEYVRPVSPHFETSVVQILRCWMFQKWFQAVDHIYEFGCGTGHNLVDAAFLFPGRPLHGLDWSHSSQAILRLLREEHGLNVVGREFNMLEPDESFNLYPRSGVFTVGAMEQLGCQYHAFMNYLLRQRPSICIHVETLYELYDQSILFDYVAAKYLEKRKYLQGLLETLKTFEQEGRLEILATVRTFGSLYHDGYSMVIWKPVEEKN
ncbi:MAG: class I SAM-dependent methyltransferase [Nitrospirales bacterium]|nr:class I SAM-dependent methyltransferase [Nitrospirales bacterium]MBA3965312.1 class I SAM-dependent methyltransferase [Nitrospirales bacterium]